jgi:mRNA interferase HigB
MILINSIELSEILQQPEYSNVKQATWALINHVIQSDWKQYSHVKSAYASADLIKGNRWIFNLKGNRYRIVLDLIFEENTVLFVELFTHAEYDRLSRTDILNL